MSTTLGADFRTPTFWQRLAFIIAITLAGTFLYSVGVNAFLVPHQFLSGGLTGIAMVLYYLTGFPIGMANLLMNIPILILSLKFMGKFYTVITILGTVCCSVFIDLTAFLADYNVVKDPLVAAISGGVVLGISMGILYRYNSNTGGLDVVGAILKKYYNLEFKKKRLIIGLALTGIGLLVSEIKNRKKLGMLTERLNNTEDFLEDLEEKTWSLNRSMKEIAKSHNSLIKMRIGDYEDFDERFYEIEDEIATIYSHLEELNKLKKNRKDVSKDLAILNNDPNEFGDNTGESEEE